MSYIEENLQKDESVIFLTKKHWILHSWAIFFVLNALFMLPMRFWAAFGLFLGLAALIAIWNHIDITTSEFGVTSKRVIIKIGVFSTQTLEMQLSKIESVLVKQGILGKMFNYGTLVIKGTGGTPGIYRRICNPLVFKKIAMEIGNSQSLPTQTVTVNDTMPCPFCAEEIKKAAKFCKHCSKEIK